MDSDDDIFLETVSPCLWQWVSGQVVSHVGFTRDVIILKSRFCILKVSLSIGGGSLAVGLFISGSSGLWSVANLNFGAPSSYICSLVVVNFAASASLSI